MRHRSIYSQAVLVSAFILCAAPAIRAQGGCEIPFRSDGHLIVVEASIGGKSGLRFIIETGATGSVIDKKVIKALGLKQMPQGSQTRALGQVSKVNRYPIPVLQIGPVYVPLDFPEADLSSLGVDGIIGLDLLREQDRWTNCATNEVIKGGALTIDFQTR